MLVLWRKTQQDACMHIAMLGNVTKVLRAHMQRFIGYLLALWPLTGEESLQNRVITSQQGKCYSTNLRLWEDKKDRLSLPEEFGRLSQKR